MARRLPPLNALRAFEAGARHLSFTLAGDELHVTQAAVSHQVKLLERYLGVKLFRRLTRRLVLTKEGEALLPVVADAFERIAEISGALKTSQARERTLSVSVTPSFGGRWLAQRLGRFWAQHPDIDLQLHHSNQLVDFSRDDVDMAVRWGRGIWPDIESEYLMRSSLSPVCSPSLLSGSHPLRSLGDLRHHTLLNEYNYEAWRQWLLAADLTDIDVKRGPVFDNPNVLEQAIISGQGVALIRLSAASKSLAAGQMVRPFELDLETDFAYYMVHPPGACSRAKVAIFRQFLLEEVAGEQDPH